MKNMYFFTVTLILLSIIFTANLPNSHASTGTAFFIKTNSTGKIYANFTFPVINNKTWNLSPGIYPDIHSTELITSKDLNITVNPDSITANKNNVPVTYTITAKNNITGTYALFLYYCGESPMVIGLNESNISSDTFNQFFNARYNCPSMSDSMPEINIVGYSNMISKIIDTSNNTVKAQTVSPMSNMSSLLENLTSKSHLGAIRVSPLQQFKSGIAAHDVTCKQSLGLIFKAEDGSPACVTAQISQVLIARGWGTTA